MGKIIGLVIAVMVALTGCNTMSNEQAYLVNMRNINNSLYISMNNVVKIMEQGPSDSHSRLEKIYVTTRPLIRQVGKISPPNKFEKEHDSYQEMVSLVTDSIAALLEGNEREFDNLLEEIGDMQLEAMPLLDAIAKGD